MGDREIKHLATGTKPQPRGWTTPSSSWWPPRWWRWPPVMIFPSSRVPERGLDWFFMAIEDCGDRTSDLGLTRGFLEYLAIYRVKRRCGRLWRPKTDAPEDFHIFSWPPCVSFVLALFIFALHHVIMLIMCIVSFVLLSLHHVRFCCLPMPLSHASSPSLFLLFPFFCKCHIPLLY